MTGYKYSKLHVIKK